MALDALLKSSLADAATAWAIGTLGAVAEFQRDAAEPADVSELSIRTRRGGIRIEPESLGAVRVFAWERLAGTDSWSQGVALCLPGHTSASGMRERVTEIGPDAEALNSMDREAVLVDLGIAAANCDACVRTRDPSTLRLLRAAAGSPLLASPLLHELPALSPTRVFVSRLGRIEVDTAIPPPTGRTPNGPHTHLLPGLLRTGRTHAADLSLPEGMVPCLEFFPPRATSDASGRPTPFDAPKFEYFQGLLAEYGDPLAASAKRETFAAVRAGKPPLDDPSYNRSQRLARRVALRQLAHVDGPSPALHAWREKFDRAFRGEPAHGAC